MFKTLIESRARALPVRGRWTAVSSAVHAALITAAVVATAKGPGLADETREPPIAVQYVRVSPVDHETPRSTGRFVVDQERPVVSVDVRRIPVPGPVDLNQRDIGSVIDFHEHSEPIFGAVVASASDAVFTSTTVDRIVAPRPGNPQPTYPAMLRSSGLPGTVVARFVVDTSGVVEPGTIVILEATHSAFADAVRAWLPQTRYFPAEANGRRVRQLVQQRVEFQLR